MKPFKQLALNIDSFSISYRLHVVLRSDRPLVQGQLGPSTWSGSGTSLIAVLLTAR